MDHDIVTRVYLYPVYTSVTFWVDCLVTFLHCNSCFTVFCSAPGCLLEAGKEVVFNPEDDGFEHQLDLRMVSSLGLWLKILQTSSTTSCFAKYLKFSGVHKWLEDNLNDIWPSCLIDNDMFTLIDGWVLKEANCTWSTHSLPTRLL